MTSIQHNDPDETIEPLPEDSNPPFTEPDDVPGVHPAQQASDSANDIDIDEVYQEGEASAAESSEPNQGNTVEGYDPDKDQRI